MKSITGNKLCPYDYEPGGEHALTMLGVREAENTPKREPI